MHQKRLSAKESYPIKKKIKKRFVVCPRPGPNPKEDSIPLLSLLRDVLGYCENAKESKHIIKSGKITVDGKVRKDHKYPIGIFDVVTIPQIKESFRVVPGEKWLELIKTAEKDVKICRIKNKTVERGGKIQLNLHDGKNLIVKKDDYKTGDSLVLSIPKLEIKKHLKREKNSLCLVIKGSNRGKIGILRGVRKTLGSTPNLASIEVNQRTVDIPEKFIFVIGDKSPAIKISD